MSKSKTTRPDDAATMPPAPDDPAAASLPDDAAITPPAPDDPAAASPPDDAFPGPDFEPANVFLAEFLDDLPLEAATGSFGPTVNDRWHGRVFDVPDGDHATPNGWVVSFFNGAFAGARQQSLSEEALQNI